MQYPQQQHCILILKFAPNRCSDKIYILDNNKSVKFVKSLVSEPASATRQETIYREAHFTSIKLIAYRKPLIKLISVIDEVFLH